MNRKEIAEIKKQFSNENCSITRICSCIVDAEKNIKSEMERTFLMLPEKDIFKYYDIFRKTLSGTIGKNLLNMELPAGQQAEGIELLEALRAHRLDDEEARMAFYQLIINTYICTGSFAIMMIHAVYDIPGKAKDGSDLFDASDEVYEYMLCAICPVKLTAAGLGYDTRNDIIRSRDRDWIIDAPVAGFLYPAFNERSEDTGAMLYYTSKPEQVQRQMREVAFGYTPHPTPKDQKLTFAELMEESLGEQKSYEILSGICGSIADYIEDRKVTGNQPVIGKEELKVIMEDGGASEEQVEKMENSFASVAGEKGYFGADNLIGKKVEIQTPDTVIKIDPERLGKIRQEEIDGVRYLLIPADEVQIEGMTVK